ncbi:MAG: hypothetical protein SFY67_16480 [Candidatus Melainabacteria bacterium]|nr:hypothetical protein [Candidatus Melainabacteria bacterium]
MVKESQIRDKLASSLNFIDPNLELIDTEYQLKNSDGSDGFIDILARDLFHNQLVVIEIKRTNQASRQAIHELIKYVALLKVHFGISDAKVRGILVSTEWDELIVPFSNFKRETPFHVDGFKIAVSEDGTPIEIKEVNILTQSLDLKLNPTRLIYLFVSKSSRDQSVMPIISAHQDAGLPDVIAFKLDYEGARQEIVYPFGFYVATSKISESQKDKMRCDEYDEVEQEINPWIYEDEFGGNVHSLLKERFKKTLWDDLECSFPDHFGRIVSQWNAGPILRFGRWNDSTVFSDKDIFRFLAAVEDDNNRLFIRASSPKFATSWKEFLHGVERFLTFNSYWRKSLLNYFAQHLDKNATVSLSIHCPDNIIAAVLGVAVYGNPIVLPWLDLVITEGSTSKFIRGTVRWNGRPPKTSARKFFEKEFGNIGELMMHQHFGDFSNDTKITKWLQLEYFLFEKIMRSDENFEVRELKYR